METIKVTIDWLDNYGAVSELITGCVATSESIDDVKKAYASVLEFHLEGLSPDEVPESLKGGYVLEFELTIRALLHQLDGVITRAAISRASGINERQLYHYMAGIRTPRTENRMKILSAIHDIGQQLIAVH
jgi:predicted RNase H-like HicB family nuclease